VLYLKPDEGSLRREYFFHSKRIAAPMVSASWRDACRSDIGMSQAQEMQATQKYLFKTCCYADLAGDRRCIIVFGCSLVASLELASSSGLIR
jgi:hypothetical protein